jgi:hypothetical protein
MPRWGPLGASATMAGRWRADEKIALTLRVHQSVNVRDLGGGGSILLHAGPAHRRRAPELGRAQAIVSWAGSGVSWPTRPILFFFLFSFIFLLSLFTIQIWIWIWLWSSPLIKNVLIHTLVEGNYIPIHIFIFISFESLVWIWIFLWT